MVMSGAVSVRSPPLLRLFPCAHRLSAGHCYLMMDDLQQAYSAYQQALYHLQDPKVCTWPPHVGFRGC